MHDKNKIDDQFTDFAWGEMSKVLDKEMPQKKRNRTIFFWLFGFAIIAAASLIFLNPFNEQNPDAVASLSVGEGLSSTIENNKTTQQSTVETEAVSNDLSANEILTKEVNKNIEKTETKSHVKDSSLKSFTSKSVDEIKSKRKVAETKRAIQVLKNSIDKSEINKVQITPEIPKNVREKTKIKVEEKKEEQKPMAQNEPIITTPVKESATEESKTTDKQDSSSLEDALVEKENNSNKQNITEEQKEAQVGDTEITSDDDPANDEQKTINESKKWSFGLTTIAYANKDFNVINDWSSYAFVKRDLNTRFATSLGLGYTNFTMKSNKTTEDRASLDDMSTPDLENEPSTSGGVDPMNEPEMQGNNSNSTYRKHFVNVPLSLHYKMNDKIGLETGVGAEFLLNPSENEIVRKFNPYFHAAFNFNLTNKLHLGISYKLIGNRMITNAEKNSLGVGGFDQSRSVNSFTNHNHLFGLKLGYTF